MPKNVTLVVPDEMKKGMDELPDINWSAVCREAIRARMLEMSLLRSRELRMTLLRLLASKSKLTEKDAMELGEKVKEGMLKELKAKGLM